MSLLIVLRQAQHTLNGYQLLAAVQRNDAVSTLNLLQQGADPNAQTQWADPDRLMVEDFPTTVWQVLRRRLQKHSNTPPQGQSALLIATDIEQWFGKLPCYGSIERAKQNNYLIVCALLEAGANPNAYDGSCYPLCTAARYGDVRIVHALLDKGAVVNAHDTAGYTPLLYAVQHMHTDIINLLLEHAADINAKNVGGQTALFFAAMTGDNAVVKTLLNRGAGPNETDLSGDTALSYAQEEKQQEAVRLLKQAGATK